MEYRRLGSSGLKLSALSFGAWVTFGNRVGRKEARDLIAYAYDQGINFFDNAETYAAGEAERVMGDVLADLRLPRDAWCVSSKVYFGSVRDPRPTQQGLSRKHVVGPVLIADARRAVQRRRFKVSLIGVVGFQQAVHAGALRGRHRLRAQPGFAFGYGNGQRLLEARAQTAVVQDVTVRRRLGVGLLRNRVHALSNAITDMIGSSHALVQERARETPLAHHRGPTETERVGHLFQRQAREVAQLDDLRGARVGTRKIRQCVLHQ